MIFVPLLHYFKCKNSYSGNEYGLRYRMIPGKRTVPDPDGGEGAAKEESILTVDYWPDPWTIEKTDPALRVQKVFPLSDEGREAAAAFLQDAFNAEPERWKNCPSMMDCDPWEPVQWCNRPLQGACQTLPAAPPPLRRRGNSPSAMHR